ncbi:MAG TPA: response regulator [Ktedonobacteraceae bacterium]|nr:response regulator [Ktedonobacteraceae bacterium]
MPITLSPAVVIADPDPAYQQEIARLLQPGFRCFTTSTLEETYRAIWQVKPALVSLELTFPDGDGLRLIQDLQAEPALKHVLIACVTKRSSLKDKIQVFRAGADDYFVKPLTPAMNFFGRMLLLRQMGQTARLAR